MTFRVRATDAEGSTLDLQETTSLDTARELFAVMTQADAFGPDQGEVLVTLTEGDDDDALARRLVA